MGQCSFLHTYKCILLVSPFAKRMISRINDFDFITCSTFYLGGNSFNTNYKLIKEPESFSSFNVE